MMNYKKIIPILLAICMALALMPVSVFAVGDTSEEGINKSGNTGAFFEPKKVRNRDFFRIGEERRSCGGRSGSLHGQPVIREGREGQESCFRPAI